MLNGKSNFGNRLVFAFIIKIEAEKLDGKSLKRLNILYEELNHRLLAQNGIYTLIYAVSVHHNFFEIPLCGKPFPDFCDLLRIPEL